MECADWYGLKRARGAGQMGIAWDARHVGASAGIDRDYQVLARTIVETVSYGKRLIPYVGDGIDVEIEMGGSTWTFDFALTTPDGNNIIVIVCSGGLISNFLEKGSIGREDLQRDVVSRSGPFDRC